MAFDWETEGFANQSFDTLRISTHSHYPMTVMLRVANKRDHVEVASRRCLVKILPQIQECAQMPFIYGTSSDYHQFFVLPVANSLLSGRLNAIFYASTEDAFLVRSTLLLRGRFFEKCDLFKTSLRKAQDGVNLRKAVLSGIHQA